MVALLGCLGLALLVGLAIDEVFSMGWAGGSSDLVSSAETFTGNTSIKAQFTLGNVTDQEQTFGFLHTGIQAIEIVVTGNDAATVTMETNSSSAPDDTLVFPAGGGRFLWDSTFPTIDGVSGNPFDATVTTTFWTHANAEEVTVTVRILYDA